MLESWAVLLVIRLFHEHFTVDAVIVTDTLFIGLHSAVARNPELRGYVQDMLINYFSRFYQSDPDALPPITFNKAVLLKDNCAELQVCYIKSLLLSVYKIQCDQV
jgi:hypothetical protein